MIEAFICTDFQLDIVIQKPSILFSKSFTRVGDTEVSMDRLGDPVFGLILCWSVTT